MRTVKLTKMACIAALYATLTVFAQAISFGPIQLRVSEALTLLPFIMPEAVAGLTVGCFIANMFGGSIIDMIFGTVATLIAALITRRVHSMWISPIPVIAVNAVVVGAVVTCMTFEFSLITYVSVAASIALSETLICYCGGIPLLIFVKKLGDKYKFFS